ncbi:MAG: FAD-dependent oxidoreductase [Pseudomonadota bacterium]|nr:FAD-dependent oxidoreductase [Pseudomonadota bacterium]
MDVAIVGGGLSGLTLLERLLAAGADAHLFEARSRFGGRVLTEWVDGAPLDLGPSWFWPSQPRMAALVRRLGLEVFEQHASGDLMFEDAAGRRRVPGMATMAGALRVQGGMGAITDGISSALPTDRLHANAPVASISSDGVLTFTDGTRHRAARIVLALPPRIAATLVCDPPLDPTMRRRMDEVPTWMAGHAKFVASYQSPFWRGQGLCGDAISRVGPLVEIHDASPSDGTRGALFGFVGLNATSRTGRGPEIERAAIEQLTRLFGTEATTPLGMRMVDWSNERATAMAADRSIPATHPRYRRLPAPVGAWEDRLLFAGSEQAETNGGLLEGALEATDAAMRELTTTGSFA